MHTLNPRGPKRTSPPGGILASLIVRLLEAHAGDVVLLLVVEELKAGKEIRESDLA